MVGTKLDLVPAASAEQLQRAVSELQRFCAARLQLPVVGAALVSNRSGMGLPALFQAIVDSAESCIVQAQERSGLPKLFGLLEAGLRELAAQWRISATESDLRAAAGPYRQRDYLFRRVLAELAKQGTNAHILCRLGGSS